MQGNHGIALAQAAAYASEERDFPIPLTVIMSKSADQGKISVIENLGATVRYCIGLLFNGGGLCGTGRRAAAEGWVDLSSNVWSLSCCPGPGHCHARVPTADCMPRRETTKCCHRSHCWRCLVGWYSPGISSSRIEVFGAEPLEGGPSLFQGCQRGRRIDTLCPDKSTIADGLRCVSWPNRTGISFEARRLFTMYSQ